jgi:hypothetical protein
MGLRCVGDYLAEYRYPLCLLAPLYTIYTLMVHLVFRLKEPL